MGRPLSVPVFALWCLFLLWAGWPTRADLNTSSVNCYCDYDTWITCEWKMNKPTNCNSEFWLYYELESDDNSSSQRCSPKNKRDGEATLPLDCVCHTEVDSFAIADEYHLKIQSNSQILWEKAKFLPSENVKPRTPGNVDLSPGTGRNEFILTWDSSYPSGHVLTEDLRYEVEIKKKEDIKSTLKILETMEPNLTIPTNKLENKSYYSLRVKSKVSGIYSGQWSDWSHTVEWYNDNEKSFLERLELGVPIFCILILFVKLLCYFSVIKIKKVWWDQIPNPAHSHLTAIIIQNQQFSAWRKLPKAKEKQNFPHWKTCLSKLFPCLLSHNSTGKEESPDFPKDTQPPLSSKRENWPVEACRHVLVPEKTNVVHSVELYETEVESEKGDADDVSFSPSPENSASSFIQNKETLADRFVQMLFLDLIGEETFMPYSSKPSGKCKDLADATESPPKENKDPTHCWNSPTRLGSPIFQNGCLNDPHIAERSEMVCQSPCTDVSSPKSRQPPEPHQEQWQFSSVSQTQCVESALDLAKLSISEIPQVVGDNPSYRSFSSLLAQSLPRTEENPNLPLGSSNCSWEQTPPCHGDLDPQQGVSSSEDSKTSSSHDSDLHSEGESWEEILRQKILRQEGDVTYPTTLATSGYRCFDNAVKQGNDQNYKAASFNVPKESGYRSFASLLNESRKEISPATSGDESESGKGKGPLENIISSSQEAEKVTPLPLFTFGLDLGDALPQKYQHSLMPFGSPKMYSPQETSEKEIGKHSLTLGWDGTKKYEDTPEESLVFSKLDFSSGIVYSTLTCHLCGHLKRCPDGNYTPLGNAQSTKCNCVIEVLETLPHPLTKTSSFCPSEITESHESGVPRTSSVEFLGKSHLEEESSLGISVSLLPQDCEDPLGSTSGKWKGSLHLKASPDSVLSPSQPFSPNMAGCEHKGNTYIKVS